VFEAFVFGPEDVELDFVPVDELFVGKKRPITV
jgi:hypothetical protein